MARQTETWSRQPDWVADHIRRYIETKGEDGHIRDGRPCLLLTTIGRKSGEPRTSALIYGEDNGCYIIVASRGGHKHHPLWYHNLVAEPLVTLQVAANRFSARARTASPAEKPALWKLMAQILPAYDEYQAKTTREIPVVILEPQ